MLVIKFLPAMCIPTMNTSSHFSIVLTAIYSTQDRALIQQLSNGHYMPRAQAPVPPTAPASVPAQSNTTASIFAQVIQYLMSLPVVVNNMQTANSRHLGTTIDRRLLFVMKHNHLLSLRMEVFESLLVWCRRYEKLLINHVEHFRESQRRPRSKSFSMVATKQRILAKHMLVKFYT